MLITGSLNHDLQEGGAVNISGWNRAIGGAGQRAVGGLGGATGGRPRPTGSQILAQGY